MVRLSDCQVHSRLRGANKESQKHAVLKSIPQGLFLSALQKKCFKRATAGWRSIELHAARSGGSLADSSEL